MFSKRFEVVPSVKDMKGYTITALIFILTFPIRLVGSVFRSENAGFEFFLFVLIASFIASCIMIEPTRLYYLQYVRSTNTLD